MLNEIHHRVKNNLSIVCSLLNMQEKQIAGDRHSINAFQDIRHRVIAMSLVHEQLYQSEDFAHIKINEYGQRLVNQLIAVFDPNHHVQIVLDIEEITLDIERAIPCGIILNEILTNAFKHAFSLSHSGKITIQIHQKNYHYELYVFDNGPGLNESADFEESKHLGMHLINMLTKQLDGQLDIKSDHGLHIRILFPVPLFYANPYISPFYVNIIIHYIKERDLQHEIMECF